LRISDVVGGAKSIFFRHDLFGLQRPGEPAYDPYTFMLQPRGALIEGLANGGIRLDNFFVRSGLARLRQLDCARSSADEWYRRDRAESNQYIRAEVFRRSRGWCCAAVIIATARPVSRTSQC